MNITASVTPRIPSVARTCLALFGAACFVSTPLAQGPATGTIEGRVSHPASGAYIETVRLTIEGTTLETFTDSDGNYRLGNVPAGSARVKAFCTGFLPRTTEVVVGAGQVARHDIQLDAFQQTPGAAAVVKMDEFVVATSREMAAAAYAINEQRFAPNVKSVVSTDEFGNVAEGNIGEFLKFLPGISIDYDSGFARQVSINGVPSNNVPVTLDGFSVAGAGFFATGDMTNRAVDLTTISINNLSRIEVEHSPTPESKGSALAGSVNMVPRSSFERSRPVFNYSAYIMMRDNAREFHKTAGPTRERTRKVHPGFDFSYVVPVNKRFGFTLSGGTSKQFSGEPASTLTWRGGGTTTNGTTFPHTTPDQPYLSSYSFRGISGRDTWRNSIGTTIDYRLTPNDRLSFSFQYTYNLVHSTVHTLTFDVNQVPPGNFTPNSTHGAAGAGSMTANGFGRDLTTRVYMPSLRWRHDGPIWKADAGMGLARSNFHDRDVDKGFFQNTTARRTGLTVSFDDIFYLRPRVITVTDSATGQPVDAYSLPAFALVSGTSAQSDFDDTQRSAYANLRRDFPLGVPFSLKGGLHIQQSARDNRGRSYTYNFVGPDERASTTPLGSDDGAAAYANVDFLSQPGPWGFPGLPRISNWLLYDAYRDHPAWFTANANNDYRSEVTRSKHAEEVVSSAYIRGDLSLLDRRLKLTGGIRAEQTNVKAEGPLTDPTRNIQYDANGNPIRGPNGQPLAITNDTLAASKLTFLDRGAKAEKEYLRLFPSINVSHGIRENLIARAAYYESIGRPNINQYAGGITLPNLENVPSSSNRITVNNAGIKAWSARTWQLRLEHYFEGVGEVSVGAFRRDFENFFGGVVTRPTPEFLALYGLDPDDYGIYDVSTQRNIDETVRMTGVTVNYKQALTFLPPWARGVQVFANGSAQRATGAATSNFAGYVPRTASWGFSLTRQRYNFRMNWNYKGRNRRGLVAAGNSIEPGTYNWGSKNLFLDVLGEYHLRRHLSFYFNLRNVGDSTTDSEISGPSTPPHAQFRNRVDYGSLWTFGVKGTF